MLKTFQNIEIMIFLTNEVFFFFINFYVSAFWFLILELLKSGQILLGITVDGFTLILFKQLLQG